MHQDLNNEVSCLSHALGPPFMPHPFKSSFKSLSWASILLLYPLFLFVSYKHRHMATHAGPCACTHTDLGRSGQSAERWGFYIENNYSCVFFCSLVYLASPVLIGWNHLCLAYQLPCLSQVVKWLLWLMKTLFIIGDNLTAKLSLAALPQWLPLLRRQEFSFFSFESFLTLVI